MHACRDNAQEAEGDPSLAGMSMSQNIEGLCAYMSSACVSSLTARILATRVTENSTHLHKDAYVNHVLPFQSSCNALIKLLHPQSPTDSSTATAVGSMAACELSACMWRVALHCCNRLKCNIQSFASMRSSNRVTVQQVRKS